MAGMFDDLIPSTANQPPAPAGMFDDLIPGASNTPQDQSGPMSWGNVATSAASNIGPSAKRFAGDIAGAVTDPIGTVGNVLGLAAGAAEKVPGMAMRAITGSQDELPHEHFADAMGQFFANRYGSIDALKSTLANDPVGVASDLASVLTGGELAAARVPGLAKAASVAGSVGRAVDPINAAVKAVGATGKGAGKVGAALLGTTTGVGTRPIEEAARAGFQGGEASKALTENMRGAVPLDDVVEEAKGALQAIKSDRQKAYNADMAELGKDQTVLDFNKIDNAMASVRKVKEYEGPNSGLIVSLQPSTKKVVRQIDDVLTTWRDLPPDDFHTPLGFDALKQRLGDIADKTKPGSAAQKVATQAYNIVKSQIVAQAPEYAKTMSNYAKASDLVREMERTLSLNRAANVDTQLRKLQSVMRDGVSTNFGQRTKLVQVLADAGATNILQKLAGQSLAAVAPRGIARAVAGVGDVGALMAVILHPALWPVALGSLITQSPRAIGEASHLAGRVAKPISSVLPAVPAALRATYQTGRTNRVIE